MVVKKRLPQHLDHLGEGASRRDMRYARGDAKAYARTNLKGIWAAALTPFTDDLRLDEDGFRENVRHWTRRTWEIAGLFVCGKQGEFFSMSVDERKHALELAVEVVLPGAQTMMSCSDQNLDVVIDLARHAERAGADYIVVHAPKLHFVTEHDETVYPLLQDDLRHRRHRHRAVEPPRQRIPDVAAALQPAGRPGQREWPSNTASRGRCTRSSPPSPRDRIQVSTASEDEWLDNILELDWSLYLCSSPPFLLQTARGQAHARLHPGSVRR